VTDLPLVLMVSPVCLPPVAGKLAGPKT